MIISTAWVAENVGLYTSEVVIPDGVTHIEDYAFMSARIVFITLPKTLVSIGENAFSNCRDLKFINIPSSVRFIGMGAFEGCWALTSIVIPKGVEVIESNTFSECAELKSVIIPGTVKSIESEAFSDCEELSSVTIPPVGLLMIKRSAFSRCVSLVSFSIPETVVCIENTAFYYCELLKEVVIPKGMVCIEPRAFFLCKKLSLVRIHGKVEGMQAEAFPREVTYIVPPDLDLDGCERWGINGCANIIRAGQNFVANIVKWGGPKMCVSLDMFSVLYIKLAKVIALIDYRIRSQDIDELPILPHSLWNVILSFLNSVSRKPVLGKVGDPAIRVKSLTREARLMLDRYEATEGVGSATENVVSLSQ